VNVVPPKGLIFSSELSHAISRKVAYINRVQAVKRIPDMCSSPLDRRRPLYVIIEDDQMGAVM